MTISYADRFSKLIFRWKGSLWKTISKDLLIFLSLYYSINLGYRFLLTEEQAKRFRTLALLFGDHTKQIPLTFLLGFYVGMVVKRWWEQFGFLAWPDALLITVNSYFRGESAEMRAVRKTLGRYTLLTTVMAWRSISSQVYRRFPSDRHLVDAGLIREDELEILNSVEVHYDPHGRWFVPIVWMQTILNQYCDSGHFSHTNELRFLTQDLEAFRNTFLQLFIYDWMSIPLVYTHVAAIAVYGYFGICLVGRQYPTINSSGEVVDVYIPLFTVLQFLFYVGWLKVGEDLMSPFGDDDEDFELNYLIDRHAEQTSLLIDQLHGRRPELYDTPLPNYPLPHTAASVKLPEYPMKSHLDKELDDLTEADMVPASSIEIIRKERGSRRACSGMLYCCDIMRTLMDCRSLLRDIHSSRDVSDTPMSRRASRSNSVPTIP